MRETRTQKPPVSKTRRIYILRLVGRCIVLLICLGIYLFRREEMSILQGMNFFKQPSIFHLLWLIWMADMLFQLMPAKQHIALGSRKHFKEFFRPIQEKINRDSLQKYIISTTKAAYKVFLLWAGLLSVLGILYYAGVITDEILFLVSVTFYVCDLICVLVWCPFRLIMKNKCCTTCRIFNWDHLMMFTPLLFVGGFYCVTLLLMAIAAWVLWELCVMMYPERFWEQTNVSLQCSQCTDKLCTQYCQKLRKK